MISQKNLRASALLVGALGVGAANAGGPFDGVYYSASNDFYISVFQSVNDGRGFVASTLYKFSKTAAEPTLNFQFNSFRPPELNFFEFYTGFIQPDGTFLVKGQSTKFGYCTSEYRIAVEQGNLSFEQIASFQNPAATAQSLPCVVTPGKFVATRLL